MTRQSRLQRYSTTMLGLTLLLGACDDPSSDDAATLEADDEAEHELVYELVPGDYPYRDGDMTICSVWEVDLGDELDRRTEHFLLERMNEELQEDADWRDFSGLVTVQTCDEAREYQRLRRDYEAAIRVVPEGEPEQYPEEPTSEDQGEQVARIGEADGESNNDAVVRIKSSASSSGGCSGTLIHPRVVLTAAHCYAAGQRSIALRREENGVLQDYVTKSATVHRHVDYTGVGDPGDDIGLIVFDTAVAGVDAGADTMRVLISGIDSGDDIIFLGWGIANHAGTGAGVLRYGSGTVNSASTTNFTDVVLQGGARICKQDSGGPARLSRGSHNLSNDLVGGMASQIVLGSDFCGYPGDTEWWAATEDKISWIETRLMMHGINLTPQDASTACHRFSESGHNYMRCW